MAWKYDELFHIYGGNDYDYGQDIVDIEQVATERADYIRLKVSRHGFVHSFDFPSRRLTVTYDGETYTSDEIKGEYNEAYIDVQFGGEDYEGYIDLPSKLAGKQVSVKWETTKTITLGAVAPRTVGIEKADTIDRLDVSRTESESGLGDVGELKDGDFAYDTDKVKIDYSAKLGYEPEVSFGGKAVQSGDEVTVDGSASVKATASPKATLSIYLNGKWNKYLIYVWRGSAWKLHQAHIYNNSKWDKYY